MVEEHNDFEIKEIDSYTSGSGNSEQFNYPTLVMRAMSKCIEASAKEMKEGYYNTKTDRTGNTTRNYIPDTRLEFIESVETLKMVLIRDIDDDAIAKIKILEEVLVKQFKILCSKEKEKWGSLNYIEKEQMRKKGFEFVEGCLSSASFNYNLYLEKKVETMRLIFAELSKLVKRLDDYKEAMYTA